jgi:hypothetical protein
MRMNLNLESKFQTYQGFLGFLKISKQKNDLHLKTFYVSNFEFKLC